jgi:hypothetical protein
VQKVDEQTGRARWIGQAAPPLLLCILALLCGSSLLTKSATWDESHYLGVGRYLVSHQNQDISQAFFHPPLSSVIAGLPLLAVDIPDAIWNEPNADRRGQRIIELRSDDWMLNASRMAMLPVVLALAWIVFRWSQRLYGQWGGILALSVFAFSPNLIAHARLITPDMTLTLMTTLSGYRLWRLAERPGRREFALAGLCLGLLLLSKYTALALVPILMATDAIARIHRAGDDGRNVRKLLSLLSHWPGLLLIASIVLWAGYFFDLGTAEIAGFNIPLFAPGYFEGAYFQWAQSQTPHRFFLMGDFSENGWWYFYLIVLAIKIPIATSLLFVGLFLGSKGLGIRFRSAEIYLWMPFLLFLVYLSFFNTIHNGFRYLMPAFPALLVLLGKYAEASVQRRWQRPALSLALLWLVAANLWNWPNYLAYQNEWIGGPSNGYLWFSDSNLDWGQDLKQLKNYMDEHGIDRIQLAYFGTANPAHYGIDYDYLPSGNSMLQPTPGRAHVAQEHRPAIVALSAYQYQGVGFSDASVYEFFHRLWPNDQIGHSILIFDLAHPLPREE